MLRQTHYDLVISDIAREGAADEGLRFLSAMRRPDNGRPTIFRPTIFYVGLYDAAKGIPPYAFGITNSPDELLHYVMDVLERERS